MGTQRTLAEIELPAPERKTIDMEGRIVKDGVRKALRERQAALTDLAHAVQELNKVIDRAEGLLLR